MHKTLVVLSVLVIALSFLPATSQADDTGIFPKAGKKVYAPLVIGQMTTGLWGYLTNVPSGSGFDIKITLLQTGSTWYAIAETPPGGHTAKWYEGGLLPGYTYKVQVYGKPWCQSWQGVYAGGLQRVPDLNCGSM